ncbi:MAG: hypothetical protein ACE5KY_06490 [Candidatus Tectimicrobiota bacterium]
MGFEVRSAEATTVTLVAEQGGLEHRLVHTLRQPTTSELYTYSRMRSELELRGRKASLKRPPAEADAWLWDQIAQEVEGYTLDGRHLTPEVPEWQSHVPLLHKVEAVAAISDVAAEGEELEKNLPPSSAAS